MTNAAPPTTPDNRTHENGDAGTTTTANGAPRRSASRTVFSSLAGLTSLAIILQGVWAGIFLSSPDDRPDAWVHVHDIGAWVTIVLAALTAIWGIIKVRSDRAGWIAAIVLTVLAFGEAHLGGLITDGGQDAMTAVHVPVAMVLLAISVWLPMHARRAARR